MTNGCHKPGAAKKQPKATKGKKSAPAESARKLLSKGLVSKGSTS